MKIKKLVLENFRTFYGRHEIEFSTDPERSVTVFIGENGSGKTTILNSIYWVFTGFTTKQFSESNVLINKDCLTTRGAVCSVELTFETPDSEYILTRQTPKSVETGELSLIQIGKNGESRPIGRNHINTVIERLLPLKLASWFIFDGEAIGHLHLSGDSKFKSDLQKTFGFSGLKTLCEVLADIQRDLEREQRRQIGDAELNSIGEEIERSEQEIESYDQQIEKLTKTEEDAKREAESYSAQLGQAPQSESFQAAIGRAERQKSELRSQLKRKSDQRTTLLVRTSPQVLLRSKLAGLADSLHEREKEQSLPEPFGTRLIDDIQKLQECICGTPVLSGSLAFKKLEEMRSRAATSQHVHRISLIRTQIGGYLSDADSFDVSLSELSNDIGSLEADYSVQEQIIRVNSEKIKGVDNEHVKALKEKHTAAVAREKRAGNDKAVALERRGDARNRLAKARHEQDLKMQIHSRNNKIAQKKAKIDELFKFVSEKYRWQESEFLKALNEEVSGVLSRYLTKNFSATVDAETYAVVTRDIDNRATPLSTGETNVLKFAVIAAIVGLAARRTTISKVEWITEPIIAPLIFDAPFSVIDSEYRAGVASNLTELASQLIFLFDSEKWHDGLEPLLSPRTGKMYAVLSRAKGTEKTTRKTLRVRGDVISMNLYNCERDDSVLREIDV